MKRALLALIAGTMVSGACAYAAMAPAAPAVKLWRLDCGSVAANDLNQFSDTDAYVGQSRRLAASCYLIKHGDEYLLWDTGLPAAAKGKPIDPKLPMDATLSATLVEQLAQIGVRPEQVGRIAISHLHFDHIGQASSFGGATLMIGAQDWSLLTAAKVDPRIDPKPFTRWISGGGKVDPVDGDRDIFGDKSVRMVAMPGHTPGHHALLVTLKGMGPVLLSGDTAHFQENYDSNGIPSFNFDRADSLASMARFKALAANTKATVIIQHEPRDVAKLPAFPKAAE